MERDQFTNFEYRIVESHVAGHKAVEVSYDYKSKPAKRFIFIKEKVGANYIELAKAVIAKDIDNGRLAKISKKYFGPNKGKKLKIALAATLCVGAVTFAGLYTYTHFQTTAQQETSASIEKLANLVKELNPNSMEDDINAANEAYNNLTDQEKEMVSPIVINRLEEQTRLFNEDKEDTRNLDILVKDLNPYTSLEREIREASKAYDIVENGRSSNNRDRRIKLLEHHDLKYYSDIIEAAFEGLQTSGDKDACDEFIDNVNKLVEQEEMDHSVDISQIETLEIYYSMNIVNYPRRYATIEETDCLNQLDNLQKLYNEDKEKAQTYLNGVINLYNKIDTCLMAEIEIVEKTRESIVGIARESLTGTIRRADNYLDQINRKYNNDKHNVETFIARVNELNPETCTSSQIRSVQNLEEDAEISAENRYSDLWGSFEEAKELLISINNDYLIDKNSVNLFCEAVDAADVSEAKSYSRATINYFLRQYYLLLNGRPGGRNDLHQLIEESGAKVLNWIELFKQDETAVNEFGVAVYALEEKEASDHKATAADIKAVNELREDNKIDSILRPDLLPTINLLIDKLQDIINSYESDVALVNKFNDLINIMYLNHPSQTEVNITKGEKMREEIDAKVKRYDLINQTYRDNCNLLALFRQQFDIDKMEVDQFINGDESLGIVGVKDLLAQEMEDHSCTNVQIKYFEDKWDILHQKFDNTDLLLLLDDAKKDIESVRANFESDKSAVSDFVEKVDLLGDESTDAEIKEVEALKGELVSRINRPDLKVDFDAAIKKLTAIREKYNMDAAQASGVGNLVKELDAADPSLYSIEKCATIISADAVVHGDREKYGLNERTVGMIRENIGSLDALSALVNKFGGQYETICDIKEDEGLTFIKEHLENYTIEEDDFKCDYRYMSGQVGVGEGVRLHTDPNHFNQSFLKFGKAELTELFDTYSELCFKVFVEDQESLPGLDSLEVEITTPESPTAIWVGPTCLRDGYIIFTKDMFSSESSATEFEVRPHLRGLNHPTAEWSIYLGSIYGKKDVTD